MASREVLITPSISRVALDRSDFATDVRVTISAGLRDLWQ
jgi:hypothetical protein